MREDLLTALQAGAGYPELHQLLVAFAQAGGTSDQAVAILEDLRAAPAPDALEDLVLELLDVATGWCAVHERVWNPRQSRDGAAPSP